MIKKYLTGATFFTLIFFLQACSSGFQVVDLQFGTQTIGGTASGITGFSLEVMLNDDLETLDLDANGAFQFNTKLSEGDDYLVSLGSAPDGTTCNVSHASGTMGSDNVDDIVISCTVANVQNTINTVFGTSGGSYFEDGSSRVCIKLGDYAVQCYSGSGVDTPFNWESILPIGVTIKSITMLESTGYVIASDGSVWSWGGGPLGHANGGASPSQITFAGATGNILYVTGEHSRASALFDDGKVYSWLGSNSPTLELSTAKNIFVTFSSACYVDTSNDLYCEDSSNTTRAFEGTLNLVLANAVQMILGEDLVGITGALAVTTTGGLQVSSDDHGTSFTNTSLSMDTESYGSKMAMGTGHNLLINSENKLFYIDQSDAANPVEVASFGTDNQAVGFGISVFGGDNYFVLSGDGKIYYGNNVTSLTTSSSAFESGAGDYVALKAFIGDVCGVKSDGRVYCAGSLTGGSLASPTLVGTADLD